MKKRRMKKQKLLWPLLALVFLLAGYPMLSEYLPVIPGGSSVGLPEADGRLCVSFIDVGQGDSAFIEFPGGKTALIDAGEADAAETVVSYIEGRGYDRVDYLICTHPHADHIGGMGAVVEGFSVGAVYMPRVSHTSKTYENLLTAIKDKGLFIQAARAGVEILPGADIRMEFVAPISDSYEELNDYSAVLRLTYGSTAFLFTGDAEAPAEDEMLDAGVPLTAQVLKVGHHGSDSSSQTRFLEAVAPRWAVISVGADNDYGHPKEKVLSSLNAAGATVIRTDQAGTVMALSDGSTVEMRTER